jgi:hypothetical protein
VANVSLKNKSALGTITNNSHSTAITNQDGVTSLKIDIKSG